MTQTADPSIERWRGQSVLITGVCGTVGAELLRQLARMNCSRVIGIDNNETELFFLTQTYASQGTIRLFLGDIRDRDKIQRLMSGIDIVLHAAALKHVTLCEESPWDAVQTNINGLVNIIDAAQTNQVRRVLFTSSDKAVNPTNVMGTTKLMGERLITAANAHRQKSSDTIFASTRFGNVLGSRGSVVPLFARQIASGGPITLTHEDMTRFIMTLEDAVSLALDAVFMARGGEVFVTKMPVVRIADLATVMIEQLAPARGLRAGDVRINTIGMKAGEKMYEELTSEEENRRTLELDRFFVVLPAFKSIYHDIDYGFSGVLRSKLERPYTSKNQPTMTQQELTAYLTENRVLEGLA